MLRALTLVLVLALLPAAAAAVTLQDIVSLSKAGVADEVLLALIDRDKDVYHIDASDLMMLKNAGVSQAVVMALLRSGRQQPPPPSAVAYVPPPPPDLIIVGHGPDRPNTAHQYSGFFEPAPPVYPGGFGAIYSTPYGSTPYGSTPYGSTPYASIPYALPIAPLLVPSLCGFAPRPFTAGPTVSTRGMFFTDPDRTRGIFFRSSESVPDIVPSDPQPTGCGPAVHPPRPRRHH